MAEGSLLGPQHNYCPLNCFVLTNTKNALKFYIHHIPLTRKCCHSVSMANSVIARGGKFRQNGSPSISLSLWWGRINEYSADSRFSPSQWETALLCNDVSHWLGANLESALWIHVWRIPGTEGRQFERTLMPSHDLDLFRDDVIPWKCFSHYRPFVRVDSSHKRPMRSFDVADSFEQAIERKSCW